MAPKVEPAHVDQDAHVYEEEHVHQVYERIANHFSSTRYKAWPIIAKFLSDLPTGWVGLDSGTGNGKYLPLPLDRPGCLWTIGMDRSANLLKAARSAGGNGAIREVVRADVLGNPWRAGALDYCISIATIHHLATYERRKRAVERAIQCVSPNHGRVLIYVWAIEQDEHSKRHIPTGDEDTADNAERGQDVFVPWVLSKVAGEHQESSERNPESPQIFNRYYHMFAAGELPRLVRDAAHGLGLVVGPAPLIATGSARGAEIVQDGWERSNYYVELRLWEL